MMNIAQRFSLLVKGNITSLFDAIEDPERSLNQLVVDMEEQMDHAKRATAKAMANEERLEARVKAQEEAAGRWEGAARRAISRNRDDDAREALRRAEKSERQAERLRTQLTEQRRDTEQIRDSVRRLDDQLEGARQRLQLLHARMRQSEARRSMGKVLRGMETTNLNGEFERLGERVERRAAEEAAYLRFGAELSGEDLERRCEAAEVDEAVEERLARLRSSLGGEAPDGESEGDAP